MRHKKFLLVLLFLSFAQLLFSKNKCHGKFPSSSYDTNKYIERHRKYCIGVVERDWNYYPNLSNNFEFSEASLFRKAFYRQYAWVDMSSNSSYNDTGFGFCDWTNELVAPAMNGFLGPIIRAVVGDKLEIRLKNLANSGPYLIYAHGLQLLSVSAKLLLLNHPIYSFEI